MFWNDFTLIFLFRLIMYRKALTFESMMQTLIVFALFIAAVAYTGWLVYKNFAAKDNCSTGCGKCNAVDFVKIEEQLKKQKVVN